MNLKIILNERSQTKQNMYCMILFIWNSTKCNIQWQQAYQWLPREDGAGKDISESLQRTTRDLLRVTRCSFSWLWWWFHGYIHISKHQILHFKYVQSIACQFYFNKAVFKNPYYKVMIIPELNEMRQELCRSFTKPSPYGGKEVQTESEESLVFWSSCLRVITHCLE